MDEVAAGAGARRPQAPSRRSGPALHEVGPWPRDAARAARRRRALQPQPGSESQSKDAGIPSGGAFENAAGRFSMNEVTPSLPSAIDIS